MYPGNDPEIMPGPENTYQSYGMNWANASNTPYRQFKKYDHEGGIKTPMIAHWPMAIKQPGEIIESPAHLVDLLPSILEVTNTSLPVMSHGKETMKVDGVSLRNILLGEEAQTKRESLFFHHSAGRALRQGGWKIVSKTKKKWELYNLKKDPVELRDLAEENPERLQQMIKVWNDLSQKMKVKNKQ
jgi:arylsulfatase